MDITPKPLDLPRLSAELATAGVTVGPLGAFRRGAMLVLHTYTPSGEIDEVLPAGAAPIVTAHTPPPPVDYGGAEDIADLDRVRTAAASLRAFIGNATPTNAEVIANARLQNRALLAILRRVVGGT